MLKALVVKATIATMGCLFSLVKTSVIFGTGIYTGVYIAQNYQDAAGFVCKRTAQQCDKVLDKKKWLIDKVEDPKALFEKAQAFIQSKLGGDGKKGGKDC